MKLNELSDYLLLIANDFKFLHLHCVGNNFLIYHEWLEDLYRETSDYFDDVAEMAIEHNEIVENPSFVLDGIANYAPFTEINDVSESLILSTLDFLCTFIVDKLQFVYDDDYESYVYSNLDEMMSFYKKNLYKIKQSQK